MRIANAVFLLMATALPAQQASDEARVFARAESFLKAEPRPLADSAIAVLRQSVIAHPTARAHALVAQAWQIIFGRQPRTRANLDSALAHVDAALALDSRNAHAFYVKGAALGISRDRDGEIAGYQRAIELDPYHPDAAGLLITALWDAGRTRDAYELGERYYRDTMPNLRALFRHGWTLLRLWEQERGIAVFRRLISLDPGGTYDTWGHGEIAYIYRSRNEPDKAIAEMETAVRARPTDQVSNVGLAMMLLNDRRTDRAKTILERELARDSLARGYGQIPAQLLLGWAYVQSGDSTRGRQVLDQVVRRDSTRATQAFAILGRRTEALDRLEKSGSINVYAGPDNRDMMFAALRGEPRFQALAASSRAKINDRRRELGLPAISSQ